MLSLASALYLGCAVFAAAPPVNPDDVGGHGVVRRLGPGMREHPVVRGPGHAEHAAHGRTGYFPELALIAATFERISAPLVLKRPPPCAASCSHARAQSGACPRGGPDRGLGGDAGLAVAFNSAGEHGASQVVFRHQLAPGLACQIELHDLPPKLLRELPGMVGIRHCRAFLERFLSPSQNCLIKCSKSTLAARWTAAACRRATLKAQGAKRAEAMRHAAHLEAIAQDVTETARTGAGGPRRAGRLAMEQGRGPGRIRRAGRTNHGAVARPDVARQAGKALRR